MDLRSLVLFLVFLPGGARRSIRVVDRHHGAQQQKNTLNNILEVSAGARDAFIPGGLRSHAFGRLGSGRAPPIALPLQTPHLSMGAARSGVRMYLDPAGERRVKMLDALEETNIELGPEAEEICLKRNHAETPKPAKYKVVFVRHGESEWNLNNQFCGWFDCDLSEKGVAEAKSGGQAIKEAGLVFDQAYTSMLRRSKRTLDIILEESGQKASCPVESTWRLNERHYGDLTGANKKEAVEKFGADQVQVWRRSYDVPPPVMTKNNEYYQSIREDPQYQGQLSDEEFPEAESLELTIKRTLPFWNDTIIPAMEAGKSIIVAAHGNSLRGIVCHLDNMTNAAIMKLNLPTGIPFVYELDEDFKPVGSMQFLGDEATVAAAIEAVKAQTGGSNK